MSIDQSRRYLVTHYSRWPASACVRGDHLARELAIADWSTLRSGHDAEWGEFHEVDTPNFDGKMLKTRFKQLSYP